MGKWIKSLTTCLSLPTFGSPKERDANNFIMTQKLVDLEIGWQFQDFFLLEVQLAQLAFHKEQVCTCE